MEHTQTPIITLQTSRIRPSSISITTGKCNFGKMGEIRSEIINGTRHIVRMITFHT